MSDFILLASVDLGGRHLRPGTGLNNATDAVDIAAIQAAYPGLLWSGSDANVVKVASTLARHIGVRSEESMGVALQAAAATSTNATSASAVVTAAASPQQLSLTIGFAQFSGFGTATTHDFNLGGVLPTGARLFALPSLEAVTLFDDATHSTWALTIGTSAGGTQVGASTDIAAATATGYPKQIAAGGYPGLSISGAQLTVRVTGGVHLNTATAGAVTIKCAFYVLP